MSREPHPLIANVSQSLRTPVIANAMFAFSVLTGQFLPFSRCETSVEKKLIGKLRSPVRNIIG